jgi:hypothetical protein
LNVEDLTLKLRPRGPYEAMDLGQALLRRNARQVYVAWATTVVPFGLAAITLTPLSPWLPWLLIWWMKPVYDRVVLAVLSRTVFGEGVGVRDLPWRRIFDRSLLWALTLGRLDPARSFNLPVHMLEGLDPVRRGARLKVLRKGMRFPATLMTTAFVHGEQALSIAFVVLLGLFVPQGVDLPVWSWLFGSEGPGWFAFVEVGAYLLAITALEPLYVACGFTLYLNRRVGIEAWDIEVALKGELAKTARRDDAARAADAGPVTTA